MSFIVPVFSKGWHIWNKLHAKKKMQSSSDNEYQRHAEPITHLQIVYSLLLGYKRFSRGR
jgi:hypothetical protein